MSDDWAPQFCLGCDKQTDGATYCSESCRLADFEKAPSTPGSSGPSSPTAFIAPASYEWSFSNPKTTSTKFYLSPAYDFSSTRASRNSSTSQGLSPSNSHLSLCSLRTTSSAGLGSSTQQLSEKATRELRAYARSFESVRLQRRRSY
ncbi:hypothetical protein QBC46DRAFT_33957 [Diplogelasinospora grovesii]|uniref:Life-span regulatory factor domain-containing protein n=1 Tax=Diplogelasinospora grovesii TaxID=303347 RepID=A0AAN6S710_9PEZI|nr:hypothetical protein QBC46DRAFT_33957 [Diplogelasinospora grovesii]